MLHKPNNLLQIDVEDEFDYDPQLDASRIVVKADDGKVTLTGSVKSLYEVDRASQDTSRVGGVKDIDNQLLVGPVGAAITDDQIAAAAQAALDSDGIVPNDAVTVSVTDGDLTMTGKVRHHYQRQAAEQVVRRVDGVLSVFDNVSITSDPLPGDVAERINKAFERSATIDAGPITVSNSGPTVYLDGTVDTWVAREEAADTAWLAPGVEKVVNRLSVV